VVVQTGFQKHLYLSSSGLLCGQHYIQLIVLLSGESHRYRPLALASLLAPPFQALALQLAAPTFQALAHLQHPAVVPPAPLLRAVRSA
jgi:hypothetical protein